MVERFRRLVSLSILVLPVLLATPLMADDAPATEANPLDVRSLIAAGGMIGAVIIGLSLAMVSLIVEHLLSIRRTALMPSGLEDSLHKSINERQYATADKQCREQPSFLAYVVSAGLQEVGLGYAAVEKSMEDACQEQAARLYRKIEYLSVIGTLAPMIGLMGTVLGMIRAFSEFASKAVPQTADFAPAISQALVTTLLGLGVAVPALAAFSLFRNRIDEFVAETSLLAEQVMAPYKRGTVQKSAPTETAGTRTTERRPARPPIPPVAVERGTK
ncbi:MAG: MotA/TolQ/ExbB proton channel family protein [Planctomycetaceae bacterium]|nr:MotA/TolQ/ExbB proton channel family protein [Planctomycetaceae bacterium]